MNIPTAVKWLLVTAGLWILSGCYTQLHPPLTRQPAAVPDSASVPDTVYKEIVRENYPAWDPYSHYYYSRYDRWRYYYGTPWWVYDYRGGYRNDYWHSYWQRHYYYPSSPSPSSPSPPKEKKRLNTGRKIPLWGGSTTKKKKDSGTDIKVDTKTSDTSEKDQDKENESTEKKDKQKTNQGRKIPW